MKPLPAPHVPGDTDAERFDNAVRLIMSVPKAVIDAREAEWKKAHPKKKRRKRAA